MRSLLLVSLFFFLSLSSLVRSDVYVSPTSGNDGAVCGSPDNPCLTLSRAIDRAQDGDTLRLLEGVFSGNGNVPLKINTGRRLTFVAGEAAETMIDCSSVEGSDCVSVSVDRAGEDSFGSLWLQGITFTGFFPKDNRHSLISIASSAQSHCDSLSLGQEDIEGDNPADITITHCSFRDNQYQSQMGSPTRLGRLIEVDGSLVSSLIIDVSFSEFIDNKIPVSSINSATTTFRFCLFRNIRNSLTNNVTPLILETYAPSGSPQFTQLYRSQISFEDSWFDQNIDGSSGSSPLLFFDAKNFFTSFLRCTFSSNQASSLIDFEGLALQISDSTMSNNQMGRVAIHSGVPSTRAQAPIVDLLNVLFESEFSNRTLRILSGSFSSSSIVSLTANCPVVERLVDESLINIEAGSISISDSNFINCSCAIRSYPSTYVKIENCNFDVNKISDTSELALISATGNPVSSAAEITTIVIDQSVFSSASDNKDIKYLSLQGSANLLISNSTFDDGKKVVKCTQITSNDEDDEALVQFIGKQTNIASNRLLMTDYAGSNCQFVCSNSNGEMCNTLRSSWIFPILFFLSSLFAIGVSGAYLKLSYSQP